MENEFLYNDMPILSPLELQVGKELTPKVKRAVVTDGTQRNSQNYCVNFPFNSLWIYSHLIHIIYIFYTLDNPAKRIAHLNRSFNK